ncbi:DUF58 domain-containing protein [Methylobacterium goesingense]|uniref:Uncharacterized protein (DUF58 family) n=1 Tax=Methylobacterium goesingense TaxID=243690 RepID=A0ABV2LDU8_9HYPH|nr:DUF58 domain-containing protein [Methylobacterium goesingense]GJD74074.1 hypothetical protein CFIICLFH_2307 [Methylobacterium goesingense]
MTEPADQPDIVYRPRGRLPGTRPGAHRGREAGGLGTFRDQVPFLRMPDARRMDVRATLRDPFEGTYVRRFEARTLVEVWALLDLSASMRFSGEADRMALAATFCTGLAASATRIGDPFGLIGCDAAVREDVFLPASRGRGRAAEVARRLAGTACTGTGAEGMAEAAHRLDGRPKIVFLISDFRWPEALITRVFASLSGYDLVPVVLGDAAESEGLPDWGLLELDDLEGAGRRVVFMRPSLRRRWIAREAERAETLRRVATRHGRPPFRLAGRFDPDAVSRHLLGT